jgi:hypothetical protein
VPDSGGGWCCTYLSSGVTRSYKLCWTVINSGVRRRKNVSVARHEMRWIVIYLPMLLSRLLVSDRYICIFRVTDVGLHKCPFGPYEWPVGPHGCPTKITQTFVCATKRFPSESKAITVVVSCYFGAGNIYFTPQFHATILSETLSLSCIRCWETFYVTVTSCANAL